MGNKCFDVRSKQPALFQDIHLQIKFQTWNKEAHHLFDYSTDKLKKEDRITIEENALVVKHDNLIRVFNNYQQFKKLDRKKIEFMVDIRKYDRHFQIMNDIPNDDGAGLNNLWRVVTKTGMAELEVGDIFKLGRIRFKIDQIVTNQPEPEQTMRKLFFKKDLHQQSTNVCKICYEKTTSTTDPLISPCACTGSVEFIHLNCLRQWLQKCSQVKKTENMLEIPIKQHKCQLCDHSIKQIVQVDSIKYNTYYFKHNLPAPYIKLLLLSKEKQPKSIYIYSFKNNSSVFIGRGSSAGIRVHDDISISRQHAQLNYNNGKIFLNQFKSKFGTLKLIRETLKVEDLNGSRTDSIQINNHVFTIQAKYVNTKPNLLLRKKTEEQVLRMIAEKKTQLADQIQSDISEESVVVFDEEPQ